MPIFLQTKAARVPQRFKNKWPVFLQTKTFLDKQGLERGKILRLKAQCRSSHRLYLVLTVKCILLLVHLLLPGFICTLNVTKSSIVYMNTLNTSKITFI